jgi:hypothetical protein
MGELARFTTRETQRTKEGKIMRVHLQCATLETTELIIGEFVDHASVKCARIQFGNDLVLYLESVPQLRQLEQLSGRLATELEMKQNEKAPDTLRPEAIVSEE